MKHLKTILCATVFFLSVTIPVFADEVQPSVAPIEQFTAAGMHLLFEQDAQQMQLVVLFQQEMKETEGAFVPMLSGALLAAKHAWTAFCTKGVIVGAYRIMGPAYKGGRVFQILRDNNPIFRIDNHLNPYTTKLHYHFQPNMKLHHPWYAPWRGY